MQITKKRKSKKLLLIDFECLDSEDKTNTIKQITEKLKRVFKFHVGEENSISAYEVFEKCLNEKPDEINVFKREYWWTVIKKILSSLRSSNDLYVINKGNKLFVLQSESERDWIKNKIDNHITALNKHKENADIWVKEQKWRYL